MRKLLWEESVNAQGEGRMLVPVSKNKKGILFGRIRTVNRFLLILYQGIITVITPVWRFIQTHKHEQFDAVVKFNVTDLPIRDAAFLPSSVLTVHLKLLDFRNVANQNSVFLQCTLCNQHNLPSKIFILAWKDATLSSLSKVTIALYQGHSLKRTKANQPYGEKKNPTTA